MDAVFAALSNAHRLLLVLAAIGYFAYWTRTHVWMPRYAHLLAAGALLLGLGLLLLMPADAPIHGEPLGWVKKGAMVAVFPALVYSFFIFCGGQRGAYERVQRCRQCGGEHGADGRCDPA
jgi:hypothetical protein